MLLQVIVVVFAASVSLVHTRRAVETIVHRHADLTEMQDPHNDPITFGQRYTQGYFVVPKINQQQTRPNRESVYTGIESSRNQYENVSNEPKFIKAIKPRRIDYRAYNNDLFDDEFDLDNNIYKYDVVKSTTSSFNPSRDPNRSLHEQRIHGIVRTPIKFEQANDDYKQDRIVFIQDVKEQDNSIYNGIITPPTAKLFTNKPSQTHRISSIYTTIGPYLESRGVITGSKCPTGQIRVVGSSRCVKIDH
ncbi:unnamed protein product [Pieris brassicae]|uniref:Uncharacterized protein n=1 Tax=Pieris brassicae TaxID=7116 RepID=A0A9P0T8X0_PIEBR|nr:unnamed protein product [Pieris brassicae]